MKIAYFIKDAPVVLSEIPVLLTQATMEASGAAFADRLRARLSEEELRDVTVRVVLKKRFFGADEVSTKIDGPTEVLRKIEAAGKLFP